MALYKRTLQRHRSRDPITSTVSNTNGFASGLRVSMKGVCMSFDLFPKQTHLFR